MYTFPKIEHLCGEKNIENLHTNGKSFLVYPLRIVYLVVEKDEIPVKAMVSVSKKKFKRAVKRNRLKRLMRETYRLNKNELVTFCAENNLNLHIAFQYISDEMTTFQILNEKMQLALGKMIKNLSLIDESVEKNS